MNALLENLSQLAMLALGVWLLLVCINFLRPGGVQKPYESIDQRDAESFAASSARGRISP